MEASKFFQDLATRPGTRLVLDCGAFLKAHKKIAIPLVLFELWIHANGILNYKAFGTFLHDIMHMLPGMGQ